MTHLPDWNVHVVSGLWREGLGCILSLTGCICFLLLGICGIGTGLREPGDDADAPSSREAAAY